MIQVSFDGIQFVAKLSKDEKQLVSRMGFKWDEILSKWTTHNPKAAYRLFEKCDVATRDHIIDELDLPQKEYAKPEIKYNKSRGKIPFNHQIDFCQWVLSRRASYIAGEAGTGKTPVLPLCINTVPGSAIVVCPSFLKLNWEDEIEQWAINFQDIQILKKKSDDLNPEADIYIVPDSLLPDHEFREKFFNLNRRFKYLFGDEVHRFKTGTARRTMSYLGGNKVRLKKYARDHVTWKGFHRIADHVVDMSGTPMPNGRPLELYPLIHRHAPHAVNYFDPHRFGLRYCDGFESEWGWDYSGNSNLEELNLILCRNYMLVKRLRDCVDMPKKIPSKLIFIEDNRGKLKEDEMRILSRIKIADIIKAEIARSEKFRQRVEDVMEDSPEMGTFGFISELRKMLGLRKVDTCATILKEMAEDNDKIIVFCWHKEVIDELAKKLSNFHPLIITGKVKNDKRHATVKTFQGCNKHRFLIAQLQSAGLGITLTASSLVCFVEPSWNPSDNDQGISRLDRIGQTEEVRSMYFVIKNSMDHLILNAHQDKDFVIKAAIKPLDI